MTDFVFKSLPHQFSAAWEDAAVWIGGVVPNGVDADVTIIDHSLDYSSASVTLSSNFVTHSLDLHQFLTLSNASLTVQDHVAIGTGGEIILSGGQLTAPSILNDGSGLQGQGIINTGVLVNNGALSGNGLTINASTIDGASFISGSLHINTNAHGFSALNSGSLNQGSYFSQSSGLDGGIYLNVGDVINTINTSVYLENGATIYSYDDASHQYVSALTSVHEIAAGGSLSLANGSYNFSRLEIAGRVDIASSYPYAVTAIAGDLTVASGGILASDLGVIASSIVNNGTIAFAPPQSGGVAYSMVINGDVSGEGTMTLPEYHRAGPAILTINGAVSAGQHVVFTDNRGHLTLGNAQSFQGTIAPSLVGTSSDYVEIHSKTPAGDAITIKDVSLSSITGYNYVGDSSGGTLTLAQGGASIALHFAGQFTTSSFTLAQGTSVDANDASATTIIVNAGLGTINNVCFVTGTRIRTPKGDVPVERLRVGDAVVTASGAVRPIKWIGARRLEGIGNVRYAHHWPVRVLAGALGPGLPDRDLFLSSAHALCVTVLDEMFVPVGALINDSTIMQVAVDAVDYWHVELDGHDVLLANGLPAESYLDDGNRAWFSGDETENSFGDAACMRDAWARPFVDRGPVVEAVRLRLEARARAIGWTTTSDMDLHLMVDGGRVHGDTDGEITRFIFPASAQNVSLISATFVPDRLDMNGDGRRLGVPITGITLGDGMRSHIVLSVHDDLIEGFHALEEEDGHCWRWTSGAVVLSPALWANCRSYVILRVTTRPVVGKRWVAPPLDVDESGKVIPLRA